MNVFSTALSSVVLYMKCVGYCAKEALESRIMGAILTTGLRHNKIILSSRICHKYYICQYYKQIEKAVF